MTKSTLPRTAEATKLYDAINTSSKDIVELSDISFTASWDHSIPTFTYVDARGNNQFARARSTPGVHANLLSRSLLITRILRRLGLFSSHPQNKQTKEKWVVIGSELFAPPTTEVYHIPPLLCLINPDLHDTNGALAIDAVKQVLDIFISESKSILTTIAKSSLQQHNSDSEDSSDESEKWDLDDEEVFENHGFFEIRDLFAMRKGNEVLIGIMDKQESLLRINLEPKSSVNDALDSVYPGPEQVALSEAKVQLSPLAEFCHSNRCFPLMPWKGLQEIDLISTHIENGFSLILTELNDIPHDRLKFGVKEDIQIGQLLLEIQAARKNQLEGRFTFKDRQIDSGDYHRDNHLRNLAVAYHSERDYEEDINRMNIKTIVAHREKAGPKLVAFHRGTLMHCVFDQECPVRRNHVIMEYTMKLRNVQRSSHGFLAWTPRAILSIFNYDTPEKMISDIYTDVLNACGSNGTDNDAPNTEMVQASSRAFETAMEKQIAIVNSVIDAISQVPCEIQFRDSISRK